MSAEPHQHGRDPAGGGGAPRPAPLAPDGASRGDEPRFAVEGLFDPLGGLDALIDGPAHERLRGDPAVGAALLEVARRHPDRASIELDIVRELVAELLVAALDLRPGLRPTMSAAAGWTAELLWADPPAKARLERLWRDLGDEARAQSAQAPRPEPRTEAAP